MRTILFAALVAGQALMAAPVYEENYVKFPIQKEKKISKTVGRVTAVVAATGATFVVASVMNAIPDSPGSPYMPFAAAAGVGALTWFSMDLGDD